MDLDDGEMHIGMEEEELMDTKNVDYHHQKNNNQLLINDIRMRMNWIIGLLVFLLIIIIYQFFRPSIIFYQTTNNDPSSLHLSSINDHPSSSINTNTISPSTTSSPPPPPTTTTTTTTTTTSSTPLSKYPFFVLSAPLNAAIVGAMDSDEKKSISLDHRAVIVTADSRPINSSLQSATVPMDVLYANQFNYDVHYFEYQPPSNNNNNGVYTQDSPFCEHEGSGRAASWCKLPVIIKTLEQMDPANPSKFLYDWLLWVDSDAMIMSNLSIPHLVQSLVDVPSDYHNCSVFYGSNHPDRADMPNAGVFFIKNDHNGRQWIKRWWGDSYSSSNLRFPWEQELLWKIWKKRDPPIRCDSDNPAVVLESLRTMDQFVWQSEKSLPIIHTDHTRRNFLDAAVKKALQNNPSIYDQSKSKNVDQSILRQWFDKRFSHMPIYLFNK